MKVVEEMFRPGPIEFAGREILAELPPGCRAKGLRLQNRSQTLQCTAFQPRERRVASGEHPLQLPFNDGCVPPRFLQCTIQYLRRAVPDCDLLFGFHERIDLLQKSAPSNSP